MACEVERYVVVSSLFAELRRRRVLRTLALYIVGTWGLMQVADVLLPALSLPEALIRYVLLIAIAGFPVALVFGWFFDITATGIRRTPAATSEDLDHAAPLRAADYLLLCALLTVLGVIGFGVLENADDLGVVLPSAERDDGPPMIGVLPFTVSGGGDDGAFFAEGVHDDLLNRLAQIQGLRVISRTSSMAYANSTKLITQIGKELDADAILEGGVRVAGQQMRINVQLIDAQTDDNLWAETYDRQLSAESIFAVQSEIARAIAKALQTSLSPSDEAQLAVVPTSNIAAYRAFHQAMRYQEQSSPGSNDYRSTLVGMLEKAIALDPQFVRPMMELVGVIAQANFSEPNPAEVAQTEDLITRIAEVAPGTAEHLTAQAYYLYYILRDYDRADQLITSARSLAPSDTRLLEIQSWIKRRKGDFDGFIEASRVAAELEPGNLRLRRGLIYRLMMVHRYDEAKQLADASPQTDVRLKLVTTELRYSQHHDLARYRQELKAQLDAGTVQDQRRILSDYRTVLLAQKDYAEAARIAPALKELYPQQDTAARLRSEIEFDLMPLLLRGDTEQLAAGVEALKDRLGTESLAAAEIWESTFPTEDAIFRLLEGDPEAAKADVMQFLRQNGQSPTAMFFVRQDACQALGLTQAVQETVACLRAGLASPSGVRPYLEPLLPYYDVIRSSPEFQALMEELRVEGWL
ncbi:hypothetical protein R0135_10480 [Congregibacter variabilis]|uniref:TolB amino-terminal domain-containing protein n=1 Tax=Congregibacter variabilis TaxID=3081200 RepID=A0ABZ0I0A3_9GAMM|nr:hypothetical protein R0135_10480 [Congregibacter sp. IMCC43200]